MLIHDRAKIAQLLVGTSRVLDIPDYVYEDAVLKYEDVGAWLSEQDSELARFGPEIYPQGSFRLGTVVRPVSGADEFDIDLVCQLAIEKERTTQKNLKEVVGKRLSKRDDLRLMLTPSRRCWVLDYPAKEGMPGFHMDVLPALPNRERPPTGILLTDTELTRWQVSNPKAFAEWFYGRMKVAFLEKRASLAEALQASIEDVPEWQVKTPLQVAVQILKRHRDIHFQNGRDNRPVSIIITTLAALAYRNQRDVYDALVAIVHDMPGFVEKRNGRWWVGNPVDPGENFADKWNEHPERRLAFFEWMKKAEDDITRIGAKGNLEEAIDLLSPSLGKPLMEKVASSIGVPRPASAAGPSARLGEAPPLGDTSHCAPLTWPERPQYKARLSGGVHRTQAGRSLWQLTHRPVPRNVWIRFLVNTNAPGPFEVHWQVVNTGKEAAEAGELRGGVFRDGKLGDTVHWETTAYRGTHWVEAFIVKYGVCVARTGRVPVPVR